MTQPSEFGLIKQLPFSWPLMKDLRQLVDRPILVGMHLHSSCVKRWSATRTLHYPTVLVAAVDRRSMSRVPVDYTL